MAYFIHASTVEAKGESMKDARKVAGVPVRMPDDLKIWLKHRAVDNRRSLNGEILLRLEESRQREIAMTRGAEQ